MDYRDRNPHAIGFTYAWIESLRAIFPFHDVHLTPVAEYDAPDDSSVLWRLMGRMSPDERCFYLYLIDRPADLPTRKAFMVGERTWMEFWLDREWLLRLTVPMDAKMEDVIEGDYIHPAEVDPRTMHFLKSDNNISPIEMRLINLRNCLDFRKRSGEPTAATELKLKQLMDDYGVYLNRQKVA